MIIKSNETKKVRLRNKLNAKLKIRYHDFTYSGFLIIDDVDKLVYFLNTNINAPWLNGAKPNYAHYPYFGSWCIGYYDEFSFEAGDMEELIVSTKINKIGITKLISND